MLSSRFGGSNSLGFDAQLAGYMFFTMDTPNRNNDFNYCYRSAKCKNFKSEGGFGFEREAFFWSSTLDDICSYEGRCNLPKLGYKLEIDISGNISITEGTFGDGGDWVGASVRCIKD